MKKEKKSNSQIEVFSDLYDKTGLESPKNDLTILHLSSHHPVKGLINSFSDF